MPRYRNVLPALLTEIRADIEEDTSLEMDQVESANQQAIDCLVLVEEWRRIIADYIVTGREMRRFAARLAAHREAERRHVQGDLDSLNRNRVVNAKFCRLYADSDSLSSADVPDNIIPLTLGELDHAA